jgi:predicted dehydrogenase
MNHFTRRSFLRASTAVGSAFTIIKPELVRGAGKEKLKFGMIGCGSRGSTAVENTLEGNSNVELVAMADIFEDKLESSLRRLKGGKNGERVKVDAEHRFVGFDAYKKMLATDIDIVFLTTPPGYRPMHFEAAVEAHKHIFAEKPFGTDPVNVRKVMVAAKKAEELKLTVKSGAQRRSQKEYVETWKKVRDGAIGDIVAGYAYWEGTPVLQQKARDPKWGDMEWEHRAWYSFVWICGDQIVEQHLHNLDVMNWFMGTHPVECVASGGVAWRPKEEIYGNIYDHICSDYVYPNGAHMSSRCRQYDKKNCFHNISEAIVGTKGRSNCRDMGGTGINPYVQEHIDMVNSILGTGPYINEGQAVAESTMTAVMGRESAYSGQKLTWDMMMNSQLDRMPKTFGYDEKMTATPLPVPGEYKFV